MSLLDTKPAKAPTSDKRWKLVDATMRRNGSGASALIESLHTVQETFGYLDEQSLRYVAAALHVPLSKVYGVATFYHFFQLKPAGEHTCVVCMGTACYIKGAPRLIDVVAEKYRVKPGETSQDGKVSLLTARCLGSCGLAPAAVLDGEVVGKLEAEAFMKQIERWQTS
jgi:bidirectional [NiFe] hydrogenase diaphorase subunit